MEIRSIHIDFDQNILEINGEPCKKPMVVYLPSDSPDWETSKVFGLQENQVPESYDRIKVAFEDANQK